MLIKKFLFIFYALVFPQKICHFFSTHIITEFTAFKKAHCMRTKKKSNIGRIKKCSYFVISYKFVTFS